MSLLHRRKKIALIGIACLLVAAAGAYAYWTQAGSGSGSAATGSTSAITVNQTSTISGLYPGQSPQSLSGTFDNPNSGPVYVAAVTATVSSVTAPNADAGHPCATTDFAVGGTATVGAQVPSGSAQGSWTGLTIQLVNAASNQDGCKGATVHLSYTSS